MSTTAAGSVPYWRVPQVLLLAAVRSSSSLGYDLMTALRRNAFSWSLLVTWPCTPVLARCCRCGRPGCVRSPWLLALVAICAAQCVVLGAALRLARHQNQQSITLICIGNWASALLITFVAPTLLPVIALAARGCPSSSPSLRPRQRAADFRRDNRLLPLTGRSAARARSPICCPNGRPRVRWIETAFIVAALPINAFHILVIAWNNAAALRVSENMPPSSPPTRGVT